MTGFMYKLVFALVKVSIKLGNTTIMVTMTAIQEISLNIKDFSTVHMSIHIGHTLRDVLGNIKHACFLSYNSS